MINQRIRWNDNNHIAVMNVPLLYYRAKQRIVWNVYVDEIEHDSNGSLMEKNVAKL